MKKIHLYAGRGRYRHQTELFVMVDDADFDNLNKYEWGLMKIYHTEQKIYYARRYEGRRGSLKAILMHRSILGISLKEEKGDHINGDGLDNRRCNLRTCTHSQNMSNRKSVQNSSSVYLGVHKNKDGKYFVQTKHEGVTHRVSGLFISEDIAGFEYNNLVLKLKGEYARLNSIRWY